jgi:RHS repeat-associated protein
LGTPQEITDEEGNIAWQAQYKAWGEAKEIISKAARGAGFRNPLRFQGQYFDHETGLHYNRFRYYDPETGRFISKDPIKYAGGINLHVYAPNPIEWVDPGGLDSSLHGMVPIKNNSARKLLKSRGLTKEQQREIVGSFDGQIYVSQGRVGCKFVVTESTSGSASGVFVTRCSAGATPANRQRNLALPPSNTAKVESTITLAKDQVLLEGKVAPQPQWGTDRTGGGWQVVTAGGKYTGATGR